MIVSRVTQTWVEEGVGEEGPDELVNTCPSPPPSPPLPSPFLSSPPPSLPLLFFRYVVVLTKADKSDNSVSRQVLDGVVSALREAGVSRTPVVLTSAASKLGRDGMWRFAEACVVAVILNTEYVYWQ